MEDVREKIPNQNEISKKIQIPNVTYHGDDKKLKERISKFKAGSFRIAVFTIVGLFMGYYSHTYVTDTFFPTKLVTAIPYKITEAIYGSVLRIRTPMPAQYWGYDGWRVNFFPYSAIACLLAEPFTTILIGGAIYGSLAYFTGDKRVFTLQRFLKFAGCWCTLILLVIGIAFGVNARAKSDNERFEGTIRFYFYDETGNGSSSGYDNETAQMLNDSFYSELISVDLARDIEDELLLGMYFDGDTRYGLYKVNYEMCYIVTEQGRMYHISEEFGRIAADYMARRMPVGVETREVEK